jgi:hypothetical protein
MAVPNPPPPPQAREVSDQLASTFADHDLAAYERLFAPGVHVYEDGKLVASDRADWIAIVAKELRGPLKVQRNLNAPSASQILVAETLSNYATPTDHRVSDFCIWARIGRYVLNDDYKIIDVRFLSDAVAHWQSASPDPGLKLF